MRSIGYRVLFLALLVALGCARRPNATHGARGAERTPIHIGAILTLSGPNASFGESTLQGAQLAQEQINAAGGVLGRPLELEVVDDEGKMELASSQAVGLTQDESVVALLGEVASSLSLAIAPHAQQAGVPMVVPGSTNPKVTEVGDRIFRVCFIDPYQGEAMAHYAWETLGYRRVAIMVDASSGYSQALSEVFQRTFEVLGGEIVAVETYAPGDTDFREQLATLQPLAPDALYVPGYYVEGGLIAVQARRLGIQARLLGGDGWDSTLLQNIGGEAIVGGLLTNHFSFEDPNPAVRAFLAYEARFARPMDGLSALGYDAIGVLAAAIRAAGSTERDAIRDALAATRDFPGVTGNITMNEKRDPIKPAVILRVTPQGFAYEATVGPW